MTRFVSCVVLVMSLFACGSDNNGPPPNLVIAPGSITLVVGATAVVSATFDNGDTTTAIAWTSSDTSVATVASTANGQATITGVAEGIADITATGGGASTTLSIAVNAAALQSIGVTPPLAQLADGTQQQLIATGVYSDGSHRDISAAVDWTSSSMANALVGPTGLVTAAAPGVATITASLGAISGSAAITSTAATLVSIAITPPNPTLAKGTTKQLTATGTFSDHTTQGLTAMVTWASDTTAAVTVSAAGLASGVDAGHATVSATLGTVTGTTMVTTTAASIVSVHVTPTNPQVVAGLTQQFTAMATLSDNTTQNVTANATWASDTVATATIDPATGLATAVAAGTTSISATLPGNIADSTTLTVVAKALQSIAVTPTDASIGVGQTQQFVATGTFNDLTTAPITTEVTWTSDAEASVDNVTTPGLATALSVGTPTITATLGAISGATTLTITPAVLVSIEVDPPSPSIDLPMTQAFTAMGTFSDNSQHDVTSLVTWDTSDHHVATISNAADATKGLATAIAPGTVTVTATSGAIVGQTSLTVGVETPTSIVVTPTDPSAPLGTTTQFTATAMFSDADPLDITAFVTWTSDTATVAEISNAPGSQGLATTVATGTATITATLGAVSGSTTLTVTPAVLVSIAVTPGTFSLLPAATQQLTATGTFSDGTTQNLTATASWTTGDPTIATVAPTGLVTAVAPGQTTITATDTSGTIHGAAAVTVLAPTVTAISPPDGLDGVRATTPIMISFNEAMDPTTLTAITTSGACAGSVQLSADDFATCIGFAAAAPAMNTAKTIATFTPAAPLATLTIYRVRVLASAANPTGTTLAADVTQPVGFSTATDGTCASALVISQIYGGGGNSGASFLDDFIEIHNAGATAESLAGLAVQYASATGSASWLVTTLPDVSVPPGGYFLIEEHAGSGSAAALPTPDATGNIDMSATAGKVALTPSTVALNGACPLGSTIDLVGYGTTANCVEGTGTTANASASKSVQRNNGGCMDTNVTSSDITIVSPPAPRNSGSDDDVCSCVAENTSEVAFCNLQFPTMDTVAAGATDTIFGQVFIEGVTGEQSASSASAPITMQVGFGAAASDPSTGGWTWFATTFNAGHSGDNNNEYMGTITAPATTGTFSYTTRTTLDGTNWTYCDIDGNGTNAGLSFSTSELGALTVQ